MRKKRRRGICPKCFKLKRLTKHHILPKRFYKRNDHTIYLCRDCHDEIEVILERLECDNSGRLKHHHYQEVIKRFIRGGEYV
ncbi:MAG: hypothetical protein PF549_04430 [Patescibacteria group bacterium]|jgi:hypothetical protein|nr:hypothetical protein [Patescibacteria group bacterium]